MAATTVEILSARRRSSTAAPMLDAIEAAARAAGDEVILTETYRGGSDWLVLFGVGAEAHAAARAAHVPRGTHAILFDLGYFGRRKGPDGFLRVSIDRDHPQHLLDRAPDDGGARWAEHGIALRDDADPAGPIILVGLGAKSRIYLEAEDWELDKLAELERRFPDRRIIHRPKPGQEFRRLRCDRDETTPIDDLLRGASLVVARHSNVAAEAVVAGVPFEAEDGAAAWLNGREYNLANRREFLHRLAWFQWRAAEAPQAWQFLKGLA